MIPLERWNVERECHFRGKRTMTWLIQPIVRPLIRPLERKVSRRDAKLERRDLAGATGGGGRLCWNGGLGRYAQVAPTMFQPWLVPWHMEHIRECLPALF